MFLSDAWTEVHRISDLARIEPFQDFDDRFHGTQFLVNWVQDFQDELWNAGLDDPKFLATVIEFCEEASSRSHRRQPADEEPAAGFGRALFRTGPFRQIRTALSGAVEAGSAVGAGDRSDVPIAYRAADHFRRQEIC